VHSVFGLSNSESIVRNNLFIYSAKGCSMKPSFRIMVLALAVLCLLALAVAPTLAQLAPSISVAPVWKPARELTSLDTIGAAYPVWNYTDNNPANGQFDGGEPADDYRYVDAVIKATTTVEFWAMELNCTVNAAVLDWYTQDTTGSTPGDWGDDQFNVSTGNAWVGQDGSFIMDPMHSVAAGQLKVTSVISQRGRSLPLGRNGASTNLELASLRFRVKPNAGPVSSPLTCTFAFLDRNGKPVVTPTVVAPAPLSVIPGHTVTGTISYQARLVKNNIGVECWIGNTPLTTVFTDATGTFRLPNIRQWDHLNCRYYPNITDASPTRQPDVYLSSWINFNVGEHGSYRVLPVELKAGNFNRNDCDPGPGTNQCLNDDDIATLTGAWNINANGDANGDGKSDKADLAILMGNWNNGWEDVDGSHVLYSVARNWTATGRDNRVWLGERQSGNVIQQIAPAAGTTDFWATLSPDGSTIVFVRKTKIGAAPAKYELYKASTAKAAANNQDAFAPSWAWDSTRIAFVCSSSYGQPGVEASGYAYNAGNLCMVDVTGRNFRQITGGRSGYAENLVKIFPPAWEGDWLLFGANEVPNDRTGCADTLCVFNPFEGWRMVQPLDDSVPDGADMPIKVGGTIFYRYSNGGNQTLRLIDNLDYTCIGGGPGVPCTWDYVKDYQPHPAGCPSATSPRPYNVHTDVVFDSDRDPGVCTYVPLDFNAELGAPYSVDYYELSPYGWEIMFNGDNGTSFRNVGYNSDVSNGNICADGNTTSDTDLCFPEWWVLAFYPPGDWWVDQHQIGSQVSNDWWDGDPLTPTLLHAERATADWQP
jgi:hypothetical protein